MYIQTDFFEWPYDHGSKTGVDYELLTRAHDMWRHAQECMAHEGSDLYRTDAICTLKRAINQRLKTISSEYGFDSLPWMESKKKVLEKLKYYGLIRPAVIKDLLEIRNALEHEDIPPPTVDKCNYLVDMVWYFLKSTDSLLDMKIDDLEFENFDTPNHVTIDIFTKDNWKTKARGTVHNSMLSESKSDHSVEIENYQGNISENNSDYIVFTGNIVFEGEALSKLARQYFGAAGYWYEDHV